MDVDLKWAGFMANGPTTPFYPLKLKSTTALNTQPKMLVANIRRHVHNNLVCKVLKEEIRAHMTGVVGEKKTDISIYGVIFSAVGKQRHMNNALDCEP